MNMNIEIFKDIIGEINELNLSDEFKDFANESFVICMLCQAYEKGREKLIDVDNFNEKLNILDFIKDLIPVMRKLGITIEMNRSMQEGFIKDMYIPHVRHMMMNH